MTSPCCVRSFCSRFGRPSCSRQNGFTHVVNMKALRRCFGRDRRELLVLLDEDSDVYKELAPHFSSFGALVTIHKIENVPLRHAFDCKQRGQDVVYHQTGRPTIFLDTDSLVFPWHNDERCQKDLSARISCGMRFSLLFFWGHAVPCSVRMSLLAVRRSSLRKKQVMPTAMLSLIGREFVRCWWPRYKISGVTSCFACVRCMCQSMNEIAAFNVCTQTTMFSRNIWSRIVRNGVNDLYKPCVKANCIAKNAHAHFTISRQQKLVGSDVVVSTCAADDLIRCQRRHLKGHRGFRRGNKATTKQTLKLR